MRANSCVPILLLLLGSACSTPKADKQDLASIEQEILTVERAFSAYSEQNGFAKALAEYASEDAIKLNHNEHPTFGKAQLQKEAMLEDSISSSQGTITWKPLKIWVAESGDMASAFGDWYFTVKSHGITNDTTLYGNYVTVWVKQNDGSWKFIIDGGNPTPGPTSDEMLKLLQ